MSVLKRIVKNLFFPWRCYQCGEPAELTETKYEVERNKNGEEGAETIAVCVHCFEKKAWL